MSLLNVSLHSICLAVAISVASPSVLAKESMPGAPEKPIRPGSDPFGCKKRGSSSGSGCLALTGTEEKNKNQRIKLSPFKIIDNNGTPILVMSKYGNLTQDKKSVGKISKLGTISDSKGKLVASLSKNDILEVKNGNSVGKISPDGTIDNGSGVFIHWLQDGTLARGDELLPIKLVPATSPARRAASIAISLYLSVQAPKVEEIPK